MYFVKKKKVLVAFRSLVFRSVLIRIEAVGLASAFDSCFPCDVTFSSHHLEPFYFFVSLSLSDLSLSEGWREGDGGEF